MPKIIQQNLFEEGSDSEEDWTQLEEEEREFARRLVEGIKLK